MQVVTRQYVINRSCKVCFGFWCHHGGRRDGLWAPPLYSDIQDGYVFAPYIPLEFTPFEPDIRDWFRFILLSR